MASTSAARVRAREPGALNWASIEAAEVKTEPFAYLHVLDGLQPEMAEGLAREDFPTLPGPGSFALEDAPPGPLLRRVIDELESDRFRALMADRFDVDLTHRATMVTLRGQCGPRDGFIHTDSKSKILTVLLYLNTGWASPEGRLRLLRDGRRLDDPLMEVPPTMGSLLVFRRADNSWHGHTPYIGPRRVLQFNYVRSEQTNRIGQLRHRVSALFKRPAAM